MATVPRPRIVRTETLAELDLPAQVTLSLVDLARSAKAHLLALSVGLGLATLREIFEHELTERVGPKGRHDPGRSASRHGAETRSVTLGGRLVRVPRPRARTRDGQEVQLRSYAAVADRDLLSAAALQRMLAGLSTRRYGAGLEPVGDVAGWGTSRSAVSRRFVRGTAATLAALFSRDLSQLPLLAVFIDGIAVGGELVVCALGVDRRGTKHLLGLWQGTTENGAVCAAALRNLIERGLPTDRALLFVTDGGKAIHQAIRDAYGHLALHQRCRLHKRRNVLGHLPKGLRPEIGRKLDHAWAKADPAAAAAALRQLAQALEAGHDGAARSIREGLEETLTIARLDLPPSLLRSFKSTNLIDSAHSVARRVMRNVKRWRKDHKMVLRWTAAGMLEAEKQFRRINGYRDLWLLERALDRHTTEVTSSTTAA